MKKVSKRRAASRKSCVQRGRAIGLTGGIACGKSEVARILRRLGAAVADADDYAHDALRPGCASYRAVVKLLGRSVVRADGSIDRRAVAQRVMNDKKMLDALERIIHPVVIKRLTAWVKKTTKRGQPAVAVVPLLHEIGWTVLWDVVICVVAPQATVFRRLAERGLKAAEARAWVRAQMPIVEKARRSDFVIRNEGSLQQLERRTKQIWECVLRKGAGQT